MDHRLNILDIWVDAVDRDAAIRRAEAFLREDRGPQAVFASNPEKAFAVPKDPLLRRTYREAGLLLPDGIGMVLAARILFLALGSPRQERWFAEHGNGLASVKICQGIGGTLDTIAGNVRRAPESWCRVNWSGCTGC